MARIAKVTKNEAVNDYISQLEDGVYDYWTIQLGWASYVDYLVKDGMLSEERADAWGTPWEYGRRIAITTTKGWKYA